MTNKVNGFEITSPDKIIYTKPKITKLDVVNYYNEISSLMLPYLKNRLLAVIRCHSGSNSQCFFKKHPTTESKYIKTFLDKSEEYFYLTTTKGIVNQAQMGTLEFHPWGSKITKIDKPDTMIFDLDPGENVSLTRLRQGVKDLKNLLDNLNLKSFLKTSGGKGYHIVVPFSSSKNWETFNNFSKQIAMLLETKYPNKYTTNIRKINRKGKIFIDYLRNDRGSTCVSPYSLRSREKPTISMPIFWEELNKIKPNHFTIKNYKERLNLNPWEDFFNIKQQIK